MEVEICDANEDNSTGVPNCSLHGRVFDHYLRTCVDAALIQFQDQENDPEMVFLYGTILPILSLLVVITNGIVVCVLLAQKQLANGIEMIALKRRRREQLFKGAYEEMTSTLTKKTSAAEPLLWMAVSSILMSLSPLPFSIYYYNLSHYRDFNQTTFLCYLQKVCMEILPFFFNSLITLFTLLLGVIRYIAVQFPLDPYGLCTRKMHKFYTAANVFVSLLFTIVQWTFDVRTIYHFCILGGEETSFWVGRCFIGYSNVTRWLGANTFASLLDVLRLCFVLVPSALLVLVTFLLIRTINTTENSKLGLNRRSGGRNSANTTFMLTIIIVLFLLARAPSTSLIVLCKLAEMFEVTNIEWVHNPLAIAFANILVITIHPISFAVYMSMSRQFRVTLRQLLGWKFLASDDEYSIHILSTSRNSQHRKRGRGLLPLLDSLTAREEMSTCRTSSYRMSLRESRRIVAFATAFHEGFERKFHDARASVVTA